ncbi:tetratricopeptide repeat protein [Micromonospora sp. M12]
MLALLIVTPYVEDRIRVHRLVRKPAPGPETRSGSPVRGRTWAAPSGLRPVRGGARGTRGRDHRLRGPGRRRALAETRLIYAVLLRLLGENQAAREVVLDSLTHFEATGETGWQAYAYRTLGIIHRNQADWPAAGAAFERALELFRAVGDRHREGNCLVHYGSALRQQGEPGRALPSTAGRGTSSPRSASLWEAITDVHQAASLMDLEVREEAGLLLDRALRTFTDIGDLRWADIAEYHRARLDLRSGDVAGALPRLERSASRFRELNEPHSESWCYSPWPRPSYPARRPGSPSSG